MTALWSSTQAAVNTGYGMDPPLIHPEYYFGGPYGSPPSAYGHGSPNVLAGGGALKKGSKVAKYWMAYLRSLRGKKKRRARKGLKGGGYETAALDGFGYENAALEGFGDVTKGLSLEDLLERVRNKEGIAPNPNIRPWKGIYPPNDPRWHSRSPRFPRRPPNLMEESERWKRLQNAYKVSDFEDDSLSSE